MEIKLQFPQKGWNFNFALTKVFLTIRHFQNALNEHEKVNRTELTQNLHFKKAFLDPPFPFVTIFSYPRPPNVTTPNKTNLSSKMETIKYILILIYDPPQHKFNHKQMDKYWDTDSFSVPKQKKIKLVWYKYTVWKYGPEKTPYLVTFTQWYFVFISQSSSGSDMPRWISSARLKTCLQYAYI